MAGAKDEGTAQPKRALRPGAYPGCQAHGAPGKALLLALSLLVAAGAPAAAPEGPEGGAGREVEVIRVTRSRAGPTIQDSALPADVLTRSEIEETAPLVLTDALRREGLLHVQTTTAGQGSPFVRGLTGSSVLNLVDGMRLNHTLYRSAPNPYLALVDAHIVERVEVVRGPGSVRYGSDAMGGSIAVVTRRPRFESAGWSARGQAVGLFGSADMARGLRAELEAGRRGLGLRAGFSGLATGDLRGGGNTGRLVPSDFTSLAADLSLLHEPDDEQSLGLDLQWLEQPKTPRYDEVVAGYGQTQPDDSEFFYEPLERLFAHGHYERRGLREGVLDALRLDVAYQRIRDGRRTRAYESPIETREHNQSQLLGVTLTAESAPGHGLHFSWGGDIYLDWVASRRHERDLDTGGGRAVAPRFPDGSRVDSYGLYLDVDYELSRRTTLTAGLRYSFFDIHVKESPAAPSEHLRVGDLTGGLGVRSEVLPGLQVLAGFRRGFRAPNIFDLGTLGERPGNRFNVPNGDLDPEVLYSWDAGLRWEGERFEGEIMAFYALYDDKIESVFTGEVVEGRDVVRSENEKEVRLAGFEAGGSLKFGDSLRARGRLLYTWGEQENSAGQVQPADRIPPLQGRVGVEVELREGLLVEPYLRFAAAQNRLSDRDRRDPRIDPSGSDGWVTLNLRGHWQISPRFSLVTDLRNVADTKYREYGSGIEAPGVGVVVSLRARF